LLRFVAIFRFVAISAKNINIKNTHSLTNKKTKIKLTNLNKITIKCNSAGHWVHAEAPEDTTALLKRFLDR
jgi:pimeloyl-ACP methyl ester carboxylesterase